MCISADLRLWREQEAEAFAKAASLDTHKALVHIFFAQRATKKVRNLFKGFCMVGLLIKEGFF